MRHCSKNVAGENADAIGKTAPKPLALEDSEFKNHKGVNLRAFTRAVLSNSRGGSKQGASTITMQVVKNEFLAGLERDGRYKVLQARYATMLEKEVPKKLILERYLNTIYLGNNTYGLQAAAEVYFGKDVRELTMLDGAFLAGLIEDFIQKQFSIFLEKQQICGDFQQEGFQFSFSPIRKNRRYLLSRTAETESQ